MVHIYITRVHIYITRVHIYITRVHIYITRVRFEFINLLTSDTTLSNVLSKNLENKKVHLNFSVFCVGGKRKQMGRITRKPRHTSSTFPDVKESCFITSHPQNNRFQKIYALKINIQ